MTTCPACTNPAQRLVAVFRQGRRDEMCPACAAGWHETEAARIRAEITEPTMASLGFTGNGAGGYRPAPQPETTR